MKSTDVKEIYNSHYFLEQVDGFTEFACYKGNFEGLYPRYRRNIELIDLSGSDRLLEVGCGRGEIVIYHTLRGGEATGIDYSEDAIRLARQKAEELGCTCNFICSSFSQIAEDTQYDKIIASEFIEHVSKEEGIHFLNKARRLLKKDGTLLVYTHPNTLKRRFGYPIFRMYQLLKGNRLPKYEPDTQHDHYKRYHLNEQNYFQLRRNARKAGFSRVAVHYTDEVPPTSSGIQGLRRYFISQAPTRHLFLTGLTLIAKP